MCEYCNCNKVYGSRKDCGKFIVDEDYEFMVIQKTNNVYTLDAVLLNPQIHYCPICGRKLD